MAASVLWSPHHAESLAAGNVFVDDLAVLAMVETPSRAFTEDQERMGRADAMHTTLGMPIKKPPGDGDFEGPFGASTALTTCLGACLGVNRPQLKRLFGAWGVTVSFRRERFSFLDVNFVAAQSLPSRKPCKLSGPLLNELVLVSVLEPLC